MDFFRFARTRRWLGAAFLLGAAGAWLWDARPETLAPLAGGLALLWPEILALVVLLGFMPRRGARTRAPDPKKRSGRAVTLR